LGPFIEQTKYFPISFSSAAVLCSTPPLTLRREIPHLIQAAYKTATGQPISSLTALPNQKNSIRKLSQNSHFTTTLMLDLLYLLELIFSLLALESVWVQIRIRIPLPHDIQD
jgi:hypothetical protein